MLLVYNKNNITSITELMLCSDDLVRTCLKDCTAHVKSSIHIRVDDVDINVEDVQSDDNLRNNPEIPLLRGCINILDARVYAYVKLFSGHKFLQA